MSTAATDVPDGILLVDTITKLYEKHRGAVVVSGSHGAIYAGYCAAKGHVRAVIQNDAGIGKDRAGIASLAFLDELRIAAAVTDSATCRIAQAADMWAGGIISHVNETAAALGCKPGDTVRACAEKMLKAAPSDAPVPSIGEARFVVSDNPGEPSVIGIDSASLFKPEDAGNIVVTASHGGLVGGLPDNTTPDVWAATYNDAGGAKDGTGHARLPDFDRRGLAAATVSNMSARIGDARSHLADGIISHVNETAKRRGGAPGQTLKAFIAAMIAAKTAGS
ncbi:hypothetical protein [Enterovirga rhinocerotis]|uniref:Uncharacterized protein n=1 Tax=Enterovirga rhinocerotis TaxID=1339210 RepID=A0A4R7C5R9_9HYPH|nr:hypothetical protein [Enterovirga rhinocerotis]TDR93423.1 hypothetical protein EV668_0684 [Enterovirga rhinocerotis]